MVLIVLAVFNAAISGDWENDYDLSHFRSRNGLSSVGKVGLKHRPKI